MGECRLGGCGVGKTRQEGQGIAKPRQDWAGEDSFSRVWETPKYGDSYVDLCRIDERTLSERDIKPSVTNPCIMVRLIF